MTPRRRFHTGSALLALVWIAACGGTGPAGMNPGSAGVTGGAAAAGGSTAGASGGNAGGGAGTVGAGGSIGGAGTGVAGTGVAGGAGTSGTAGMSGSGGVAGVAGSGAAGTTGAAGRGGGGGAAGVGGGGAGAGGGGRGGGAGGRGGGSGGGTAGGGGGSGAGGATGLPSRASVLDLLRRANTYFVNKWPDPGTAIDSSHTSHIWTRAVYYEGLMALNAVDPQASYVDYAVRWGTSHSFGLVGGTTTRSADNQCAGQTYVDLYNMDMQATRIRDIRTDIDMVVAGAAVNDWTWVDAIQMAMPVYAKLGRLGTSTNTYDDKAHAMYANTKNVQGGNGLYSKTDHLWWRDQDFDPPYTEPNGKSCYWSRGNGWVYAALTRMLDILPASEAHRPEYLADFQAMSEALRVVQRSDGFWNVSLHDPTHFGGPELTGTSLFSYGMAWGVRTGALASASYQPVIARAWTAMASTVHANGFLGYVQGTGKQPSDSQPVTFDSVPNFEDFGLGCFLLGGSEIARLASP